MKNKLDAGLSIVLTIAVVVMAAVLVRREFLPAPDRADEGEPPPPPPTYVADWQDLISIGVRVGSPEAPITIVEFADLQCPACRDFQRELREVRQRYGSKIAVVFVHFPLSNHRSALPAARALECARGHGAFSEFLEAVYAKQDSLGAKSYVSYAHDAGILDSGRFSACAEDTVAIEVVSAGLAAGNRLKIPGTPTVLINGWQYLYPPRAGLMMEHIEELLAGKPPVADSAPSR
jgi:protein-disulfide isomerase